ncbi:MAG: 1,4-dihydroxy-6-naphthoate synthase [Williamsia sp.]|nr:1,4-dihydroxy-6-naphthoate synthase [Williamsia sp.]
MKYTLGFSPCPNDTFIFDALVNGKIDTHGLEFEPVLEDVQTLNTWAREGRLDISKISYGVLPLILDQYAVLDAGGALGKGVGPLLISKAPLPLEKVAQASIAIPGENTTAHMLFSLAFPHARNKQFMLFSKIEEAVLSGQVDAGVIIHENRFTYQQKGLVKLIDLGEYWEKETGSPIPLGGIVVRKSIGKGVQQTIDTLIRESVDYSYQQYPQLADYIKLHSQEMDEAVMRKHIDLYVNNYSLSLQEEGRRAVHRLLDVYQQLNGQLPLTHADVFTAVPAPVR